MRASPVVALVAAAGGAAIVLVAGVAAALVGTASLVGGSTDAPAPGPATAIESRPVAIATLPCATNLQAKSTGYLIDDRTVVTVGHAIYESRAFAVRDATGRWHEEVEVVHLDRELDLAVLHVPELAADRGTMRVAAGGESGSMLEGAASGTVSGTVLRRVRMTTAIVGDFETTAVRRGYELDIAVKPGDSGAGVIDDAGNLVGIVFARSTRRDASWAISAAEVGVALQGSDVPAWQCDRPSDATLVLEPLDA